MSQKINYLPNNVYDIIKWVALMLVPAISAGLVSVSEIWGFTIQPEVLGTLNAIAAVLGVIINVSNMNYSKAVALPAPTVPVQVHQVLLKITLYWLPAIAACYYAASLFVAIPYPGQIVRTIITVQVFLGLILGTYSTQSANLRDYFKKKIEEALEGIAKLVGRQNDSGNGS